MQVREALWRNSLVEVIAHMTPRYRFVRLSSKQPLYETRNQLGSVGYRKSTLAQWIYFFVKSWISDPFRVPGAEKTYRFITLRRNRDRSSHFRRLRDASRTLRQRNNVKAIWVRTWRMHWIAAASQEISQCCILSEKVWHQIVDRNGWEAWLLRAQPATNTSSLSEFHGPRSPNCATSRP